MPEGFKQRTSGRRFYDHFPPLRVVGDPTRAPVRHHALVRTAVVVAWWGMGLGLLFAPAATKSSPSFKFATLVPHWTITWGVMFVAVGVAQSWSLVRRWAQPCPGLFAGSILACGWSTALAVEFFSHHLAGVTAPFTWGVLAVVQISENHWLPVRGPRGPVT